MIGYTIVSASEEVCKIDDPLTMQVQQEKYLTPYGYTLDNPNIILNPYGISPLTALILFETKNNEEVTITIYGKDENSTYTNTFKSSTKHYLPVYGLYPNHNNKVQVKCGNKVQTYTIKTDPLPDDLHPKEIENNTNQLHFITTTTYPYALDSNNEVRWYLTKSYSKKITRLENGNLLLSNDTKTQDNHHTGLIEIDLLGKVFKQYTIENNYYGSYAETSDSLFVLSKDLLAIDKQTGTLLSKKKLSKSYNNVSYHPKDNTITLSNQADALTINLTTQETTTSKTSKLTNEEEIKLPLYSSNANYKLTKAVRLNTAMKTPESKKNIFLVGYKDIDEDYQKYDITITQNPDNFQITGEFLNDEEVYLILDQFLNKKVYDITSNHTIINKTGLSGKYSIYLKIADTIYKTNTYINF